MIAAAVAAAATSLVLVGVARRVLAGRGIVDQPGERRSHDTPTPRGGGVGLVAAWLIWLVVLGWQAQAPVLWLVAAGTLVIAVLGLWDDLSPLSARFRLTAQVATVAGMLAGLSLLEIDLGLVVLLAGLAAIVWLINAYNFMDGIDGIAGWQAVFVAGGLAWLVSGPLAGAALGLVAATAGFLPWNWPRARIFLGDVGSTALGFALGILSLLAIGQGLSAWLPLLLLSVFLVDATATLALRVWRRERWYTPHRRHSYQLLVARGWSHAQVAGAYMAVNLLLVAPATWLASGSGDIQALTCIGVYAILLITWWLARR